MGRTKEEIGYIDIPKDYINFTTEQKKAVCNKILDKLLLTVDRELPAHINRIQFIDEILESTLETNEEEENYEVCSVIRDIKELIN
jgi:hypothetical protein